MLSHAARLSRLCSYERQYAHQRNRSCDSQFCVCRHAFLCPVSWPADTDNYSAEFIPIMKKGHQRVVGSIRNAIRNAFSENAINTTEKILPFQFLFPNALAPKALSFVDIDSLVRNVEFLRSSQHIVQDDSSKQFGSISNGFRMDLMFLLDNVSRNVVKDVVHEKQNFHKVQVTH